ncbi:MAG: hypothetical protein JJU25_18920 [Halomonas sp.]|nr:hypothetical protein [Halomonas sp.]MCC5884696.1 hypothetical protein [Halomonas sp.]
MEDLYHDPVFYLRTHSWEKGLRDIDAFEKIKTSALSGEPEFVVLESWYKALGKGCEIDALAAIEALEREDVQGNARSLCAAGLGFMRGYYGEKSEEKALLYFDKAEKVCSRKGSYFKGVFYYRKFLENKSNFESFERAAANFKKAAKSGHATSLKMYLSCSSKYRSLRFINYVFVFFCYMVNRQDLGGPERWWCYRDLESFRPSTVEFAENCGHALGYYSKK